MIRSMTGFGRASFSVAGLGFAVEIRSVNHRHLDVGLRLPRLLSAQEPTLRSALRDRFARGKVEMSVALAPSSATATSLEIDRELARQYVAFAEQLRSEHGIPGELAVSALLALPGVARIVEHELPEDVLAAALERATQEAADQVEAMRSTEGAALDAELRGRLEGVSSLVEGLGASSEAMFSAAKDRLRKRTQQIRQEAGVIDEARLYQEILMAADRLDVTEELVRLRSHLQQFTSLLASAQAGVPLGRRLEFLLQEMGREANTIGSKAADSGVAHLVVDLKTELERIREQVQNVE